MNEQPNHKLPVISSYLKLFSNFNTEFQIDKYLIQFSLRISSLDADSIDVDQKYLNEECII